MLTFNADTHEYFWNGVKKKSVTQVMKEAGMIDDRYFTDFARERGTLVHSACELLMRGCLNRNSVDPRIVKYVDAFETFLAETGFQPVLIEEAMYHPGLDVAGTLDIVGVFYQDRYDLFDIKTGDPGEDYERIQTRFYQELVEHNYPDLQIQKRFGLHLRANGNWDISRAYIRKAQDLADCNALLRVEQLRLI